MCRVVTYIWIRKTNVHANIQFKPFVAFCNCMDTLPEYCTRCYKCFQQKQFFLQSQNQTGPPLPSPHQSVAPTHTGHRQLITKAFWQWYCINPVGIKRWFTHHLMGPDTPHHSVVIRTQYQVGMTASSFLCKEEIHLQLSPMTPDLRDGHDMIASYIFSWREQCKHVYVSRQLKCWDNLRLNSSLQDAQGAIFPVSGATD